MHAFHISIRFWWTNASHPAHSSAISIISTESFVLSNKRQRQYESYNLSQCVISISNTAPTPFWCLRFMFTFPVIKFSKIFIFDFLQSQANRINIGLEAPTWVEWFSWLAELTMLIKICFSFLGCSPRFSWWAFGCDTALKWCLGLGDIKGFRVLIQSLILTTPTELLLSKWLI